MRDQRNPASGRKNGCGGGHNGMQNIIDQLGTSEIKRIRIGIGEPNEYNSIDYVLGKPLKEELPLIDESIKNTADAVREILKSSFEKAMSLYN